MSASTRPVRSPSGCVQRHRHVPLLGQVDARLVGLRRPSPPAQIAHPSGRPPRRGRRRRSTPSTPPQNVTSRLRSSSLRRDRGEPRGGSGTGSPGPADGACSAVAGGTTPPPDPDEPPEPDPTTRPRSGRRLEPTRLDRQLHHRVRRASSTVNNHAGTSSSRSSVSCSDSPSRAPVTVTGPPARHRVDASGRRLGAGHQRHRQRRAHAELVPGLGGRHHRVRPEPRAVAASQPAPLVTARPSGSTISVVRRPLVGRPADHRVERVQLEPSSCRARG